MKKAFSKINKRDGSKVDFNHLNINADILKAGVASGEFDKDSIAERLTTKVLSLAMQKYEDKEISVENIQDIVEEVLLASSYKQAAKQYILQRDHDNQIKEIASAFNVNVVDKYLNKKDWKVNENSNMAYSLQGMNNYITSEICKVYWLNKIYSKEVRKAHSDGDLHIHDLNSLSTYCVGWDLYDLLVSGFTGVEGKVESSPAKHFRTALGQVVNFFYTLQGEAAGAQAFSNFDTLLAPFIYYDKLDYGEVKQALQEFIFNCNVPTRVGFQSPFTNLTLDLTVPAYYSKQGVVIGGKVQDRVYSEFQSEMDLLNNCLMEVMLEGDAKGRVFTFPIPTYNITKDFDWGNTNLDNLWKMTGKYGVPYFANFINSDMKPEDARSMCCRLKLAVKDLAAKGGGLFGAAPLTGSIGVVTLNMARLGFKNKTKGEFFKELDRLLLIAKDSLEVKRKSIEELTNDGLYPYTKFYLRNIKERFNCYWKNHFSTIGINGMHECCLNFLGVGIIDIKGKEFVEEVLQYIREKLVMFQKETGNNYNLEATPAEGVSYRFALMDSKKYPEIKTAYCKTNNPYYTNSTHVPVDYSTDIFQVLDHQDSLQVLYTGGTVVHIFVGEKITDLNTIKNFVKIVCERYRLPYFTLTPTFSVCPSCGYIAGEKHTCPKCDDTTEIYSRIVGYLRPVSQWNKGKKSEFTQRKVYKVE